MAGRRNRQVPRDDGLCRRCHENEPNITVRTEPLCKACFIKYVQSKVVKRMEAFRVRYSGQGNERVLLLPLSLGVCSVSLLHILSRQLRGQLEKTGRTGFKLHVLQVQQETGADSGRSSLWADIKARYPEHSYSSIVLSDVVALDPSIQELFPDQRTTTSTTTTTSETLSLSGSERLESIFNSLGSTTSRADVSQILQLKLIASFAERHQCEAILWGDSTTRLAERTIAETAKGRGFSLPWIVSDGTSPDGLPFLYPMRDLLSKEIAAFAGFADPPLGHVEEGKPLTVSSKHATIDSLMKQYIESVEKEYPSIVANVVKTTAKLQSTSLSQVVQQCELCAMPLDGQAPKMSRLCYGCLRTLSLNPS